jgi:hypothetical protein
MKRVLGIILVMACVVLSGARWGYSACIEVNDLDLLIKEMKQKIAGQEKTFESLKAKYLRIMKQKKELLDFIEQDKQEFKEKLAQQMLEKKNQERANSLAEQKAGELKTREEEKKKIQLAQDELRKKEEAGKKQELEEKEAQKKKEQVEVEKERQEQAKSLAEQKERLGKAERERQIDFALARAKKILKAKDISCLDLLIKKQNELCAVIIQLELKITSEEKNLELLKESRKFLSNPQIK